MSFTSLKIFVTNLAVNFVRTSASNNVDLKVIRDVDNIKNIKNNNNVALTESDEGC